MEVNYQPPIKVTINQVTNTLESMSPNAKHWFIGGDRCLAIAIKFLQEGKILAVPTDTIYGLATLAQNSECLKKLYEIKGREKTKPLAICVSSIRDIPRWAETQHLPNNLLQTLLPGPVTVVLKRKPELNPALNEGIDTVGIRVTDSKFVRSLAKVLNEPLALTSANSSNEPSSLTTEEFSHLWDKIDGIFYTIPSKKKLEEINRVGSTIIDLTVPYEYKVIRHGIKAAAIRGILGRYGYKQCE